MASLPMQLTHLPVPDPVRKRETRWRRSRGLRSIPRFLAAKELKDERWRDSCATGSFFANHRRNIRGVQPGGGFATGPSSISAL